VKGITHNIDLQPVYYPGWKVRIYVASDVPASEVAVWRSLGAVIVEMGKESIDLHGALWRFIAASDPSIDRYVVRDADSRLNSREVSDPVVTR